MTEKRKPTYDLDAFKAAAHRIRVTVVATRTAAALGFGRVEIEATIQTMQRKQFYKSMTAYYDYRRLLRLSDLAGCVPRPLSGRDALRQVHSGCRDGVCAAVVQGETQ
jgi:Motility quorum-sensing regulator, toxin of MqsA